MTICLVTPAAPGSRKGNRVTALRWAKRLRELGHRVRLREQLSAGRWDLVIGLHARKSAPSVTWAAAAGIPVIVALTGTDLYDDLARSPEARRALELARRIVTLQPLAVRELPPELRARTRPILQSARAVAGGPPDAGHFDVCVVGHLREVKDPLRAATAARLLPPASRVRVLQVGGPYSDGWAEAARAEAATNPRYRWLGERPRVETLALISRCRLLALTSRLEGGANVISEALAAGVPVVSSRIDGSIGILGPDYPGYFPVGDTKALAALLGRCERDGAFLSALTAWCAGLRPLVEPSREREAWKALLAEIGPGG
jgi:putative glycosyltransferase (TIGR04348 family)